VLLRRRYYKTQTPLCIGPRPMAEIEQQSGKM